MVGRDEVPRLPFLSLQIQSVLYNIPLSRIHRSLEYLDTAAGHGRKAQLFKHVVVSYGDCSLTPILTESDIHILRSAYHNIDFINYDFFGENIGSAAGHNALASQSTSDFVMIMIPDVLVAPNLFVELFAALGRPQVGLVEARQAPIEHPKYYDPDTGETSWASTACAIAPLDLFRKLDGFDAANFHLYYDDVDFSWRARLAGYKVVMQDTAVVFHDKMLDQDLNVVHTDYEKYYSAEADLLLPYKYSRHDIVEEKISSFQESDDPILLRAASTFELRLKSKRLPTPIDPMGSVSQFIDGKYAKHRM